MYSQSTKRGMECPLDLLQWSTLNFSCLLTDSPGIETLCQILLIFQLDNCIYSLKIITNDFYDSNTQKSEVRLLLNFTEGVRLN